MQLCNTLSKEELELKLSKENIDFVTISFYQYAKIENPKLFRDHFYLSLDELKIVGRVYVASEGINAQISCPSENLPKLQETLNEIDFLENVRLNIAVEEPGEVFSFLKLKVKVRPKIVADGLNDESFDPSNKGIHLSAEEFNELTNKGRHNPS